jgi:galactokinase/mevalonate kinase-like predicted kinase
MPKSKAIVPITTIQQRILFIRGKKVIIDADLAEFYGVTTKALNQAVRRNKGRFPKDFVFLLTKEEKKEVVTNCDHLRNLKFSSVSPYAFTEHGAIMAASVLNSTRAVEVSVYIVRAFVKLRRAIVEHEELAKRMVQLERHLMEHDEQISAIVQTIRQLANPQPVPKKRRIGFQSDVP